MHPNEVRSLALPMIAFLLFASTGLMAPASGAIEEVLLDAWARVDPVALDGRCDGSWAQRTDASGGSETEVVVSIGPAYSKIRKSEGSSETTVYDWQYACQSWITTRVNCDGGLNRRCGLGTQSEAVAEAAVVGITWQGTTSSDVPAADVGILVLDAREGQNANSCFYVSEGVNGNCAEHNEAQGDILAKVYHVDFRQTDDTAGGASAYNSHYLPPFFHEICPPSGVKVWGFNVPATDPTGALRDLDSDFDYASSDDTSCKLVRISWTEVSGTAATPGFPLVDDIASDRVPLLGVLT